MFDLSLAELLLIVVVAVVFIGPKDLPIVVRAVAKFMTNLRGFTHEIKAAFDDLAKESGAQDIKNTLDAEIKMIQGNDGQMYESYQIPEIKDQKDDRPSN